MKKLLTCRRKNSRQSHCSGMDRSKLEPGSTKCFHFDVFGTLTKLLIRRVYLSLFLFLLSVSFSLVLVPKIQLIIFIAQIKFVWYYKILIQ